MCACQSFLNNVFCTKTGKIAKLLLSSLLWIEETKDIIIIIIVIIIHEFHGDTSLETKLPGRSKCHVLG